MKTLVFAALLFLTLPGWSWATEPAPAAEESDGTPAFEESEVNPASDEPEAAQAEESGATVAEALDEEITLEESTAGGEPLPAGAAADEDGELGWMASGEDAESAGAEEHVAEAEVAGDAPGAATAPASRQPAPGDSLMMDVGEVLDELLWPEPYLYQSAGTRDPFAPLVGQEHPDGEGPLAIGDLIVVGVVWGDDDRFALVETRSGKNLVMRPGDRVQDGRVIEVLPDGVRISHTLYGITRVVTMPVRSGLEGKDER